MGIRKIWTIFLLATLPPCIAACKQDLLNDVHYTVTLDPGNTYKVGEPVVFDILGTADQIVFYSGEAGHQYQYKDRTSIPFESIKSINLTLRIQPRFGAEGGLEIFITGKDNFSIKGGDGAADRAAIQALYDAGMPGWEKLEWVEGKDREWSEYVFDIGNYAECFAIAFHWCPSSFDKTKSQRTYYINGFIDVSMEGVASSQRTLRDLTSVSVMMNEEIKDPYVQNNGSGSFIFNADAAQYDFQGVAAEDLDYDLDGWVFSQPISLNSVDRDLGSTIKSILHYPTNFEYTYFKAGTYYAGFLGLSETVQGRSEQLRVVRVTITN